MKLKAILLTAAATISLATATMAQVPNYVPTNGLLGWYPFSGNANDESGLGTNGNVFNAILSLDRFNVSNSAYNFNGNNSIIDLGVNGSINSIVNDLSFSYWVKLDLGSPWPRNTVLASYSNQQGSSWRFISWIDRGSLSATSGVLINNNWNYTNSNQNTIQFNQWFHVVHTKANSTFKTYINGILVNTSVISSININNPTAPAATTKIGVNWPSSTQEPFKGLIDDIGFWNRALTQQEITALYNVSNCANNTTITPQTNSLPTGSTATFTATTSDPNPSYVWQSNFGQGFQTLNNFANYSGVNTATLNIANVQLSEHNQPIRVISTAGNCIDTSNVAVINILDTCLVTVYDTLLTTVTDTLVINAQITGINPPNNLNTLKVFPNPASTHITIDYGNFNAMNGYTLKIVNSVGQIVFTTPINQQTSYIDLSTWTGNGIYFVQLIDPQNNTIENRKIVIQ